MNYKVSVIKTFSSAHSLREYKGRCERLHGHNWKIKLTLGSGKLNKIGMTADFTDIKSMLDGILKKLDHRFINEVKPFDKINPTAENIAGYIFSEAKRVVPKGVKVVSAEVWESDTSSAEVTD